MNKCVLISLFSFTFIFLSILSPNVVFAHPGNTAADGCHYCRTNCAKWGVPEGERHCHGGKTEDTETKELKPLPLLSTPPTTTPKSLPSPKPSLKPSLKPSAVSSPKVVSSPKSLVKTSQCSATTDSVCGSQCTAGNDADCCSSKLKGYSWYENWGCYPSKLSCSATLDNVCDQYCSAGNDHDCCLQQDGYTWYENWGCYPIQ